MNRVVYVFIGYLLFKLKPLFVSSKLSEDNDIHMLLINYVCFFIAALILDFKVDRVVPIIALTDKIWHCSY